MSLALWVSYNMLFSSHSPGWPRCWVPNLFLWNPPGPYQLANITYAPVCSLESQERAPVSKRLGRVTALSNVLGKVLILPSLKPVIFQNFLQILPFSKEFLQVPVSSPRYLVNTCAPRKRWGSPMWLSLITWTDPTGYKGEDDRLTYGRVAITATLLIVLTVVKNLMLTGENWIHSKGDSSPGTPGTDFWSKVDELWSAVRQAQRHRTCKNMKKILSFQYRCTCLIQLWEYSGFS